MSLLGVRGHRRRNAGRVCAEHIHPSDGGRRLNISMQYEIIYEIFFYD